MGPEAVPDDRFVHEDANYMLLGLVIEEITAFFTLIVLAMAAGVLVVSMHARHTSLRRTNDSSCEDVLPKVVGR